MADTREKMKIKWCFILVTTVSLRYLAPEVNKGGLIKCNLSTVN